MTLVSEALVAGLSHESLHMQALKVIKLCCVPV